MEPAGGVFQGPLHRNRPALDPLGAVPGGRDEGRPLAFGLVAKVREHPEGFARIGDERSADLAVVDVARRLFRLGAKAGREVRDAEVKRQIDRGSRLRETHPIDQASVERQLTAQLRDEAGLRRAAAQRTAETRGGRRFRLVRLIMAKNLHNIRYAELTLGDHGERQIETRRDLPARDIPQSGPLPARVVRMRGRGRIGVDRREVERPILLWIIPAALDGIRDDVLRRQHVVFVREIDLTNCVRVGNHRHFVVGDPPREPMLALDSAE